MNTKRKHTHGDEPQKKTLLVKLGKKAPFFGKKLASLKYYFKRAAMNAISAIKNTVHLKKDKIVKKQAAKKTTNKKLIPSTTHKKRPAAAKKNARVNDANDINIYA